MREEDVVLFKQSKKALDKNAQYISDKRIVKSLIQMIDCILG